MKTFTRFAGGASLLAFAAAMSSPAYAAGTASGTDITNTVTVNYNVGGFAQTPKTANDVFKVDRKVNVVVTTTDSSNVSVSPGQVSAVTTFTVKNESNAAFDFALTIAQPTSDQFNLNTSPAPVIYRETNGTPGWQSTDTVVTSLSNLGATAAAETVYIVGDIPTTPSSGNVANVILRAVAHEVGGAAVVATPAATANGKNTVETVFADAAGAAGDVVYDGGHSAQSGYVVSAANLTVAKTSTLLSDPISRSGSAPVGYVPKMIPGAYVQYCLAISNASGSANATAVKVTDAVPATLLVRTTPALKYGAASSGAPCTVPTNAGTNATSGNNIDVTFPTVAAGSFYAVVFEVEIQ